VAGENHSSPSDTLIELDLRFWLSGLIPLSIVLRLFHRRSHLPYRWLARRGAAW